MWPRSTRGYLPTRLFALTLKWTVTQGWVERSGTVRELKSVDWYTFLWFSCSSFSVSVCPWEHTTLWQILSFRICKGRLSENKSWKERVCFYKQPRIGESCYCFLQKRLLTLCQSEKTRVWKSSSCGEGSSEIMAPGRLSLSTLLNSRR